MIFAVKKAAGILVFAAFLAPRLVLAEDIDKGTFSVYHEGKAIGSETFELYTQGDSLVLEAVTVQNIMTRQGEQKLRRNLRLIVSQFDYELRNYESNASVAGDSTRQGVVPGDTVVTVFHEGQRGGEGLTYAKPAGRMFVFESGVYSLIDIAMRNLSGVSFGRRDISLLVLGARDTMVSARVERVGKETIPWGATSVVAEHFRLSDPSASFDVWMHPNNKMIRLESADFGLRVDRKAPPVKAKNKGES